MGVFTIDYSFRGEAPDDVSHTKVNLASSVTVANAIIWAQEFAKILDAITDGALTNISMSLDVSLPAGIRTEPLDGSRASAGAYFGFRTAAGYPTSFRVPTRLEAIVIDGTRLIDVDDDDVIAVIEAVTAGINLTGATPVAGTGTVGAVDTHADHLAVLKIAKEQFKS